MKDPISWDDLHLLMDEVKAMARSLLRRENRAALVQTALRRQRRVDEDWSEVTWPNRKYFFGAMHLAMRLALIDHAKKRAAEKRRREVQMPPEVFQNFDFKQTLEPDPALVVDLGEALDSRVRETPQLAEVIKHRFYSGLTQEKTAEIMGVSIATVQRWWYRAQMMLDRKIKSLLQAERESEASL